MFRRANPAYLINKSARQEDGTSRFLDLVGDPEI